MKTTPVTFEDLQSSVIAVPPLCRNKDLSLSKAQNSGSRLIEVLCPAISIERLRGGW